MRGHGPSTEAMNVLDDVPRLTGQWIRRWALKIECDNVSALGADFRGVDAENAVTILRGLETSGIAMVGEDHEVKAGSSRGSSDIVERAAAVRSCGVHVIGAPNQCPVRGTREVKRARRQRQRNKNSNGGHDGRR